MAEGLHGALWPVIRTGGPGSALWWDQFAAQVDRFVVDSAFRVPECNMMQFNLHDLLEDEAWWDV